ETAAIPRRLEDAKNGAAAEAEAEELLQADFQRPTEEKVSLLAARVEAKKAAAER
ncbi:unnamed protein product, partial [Sphacelaria rigidula]